MGRRRGRGAHVLQRFVVALVAQLHLDVVRPHVRQLVHLDKWDEDCFVEYNASFFQLFVVLVEFGELNPKGAEFACSELRVYCLYRFCIGVNDLTRLSWVTSN